MRNLLLFFLLGLSTLASAQTNSTTSGNWNDASVWSTGVVPIDITNANINHPLTINQDVIIASGDYIVNSNAIDLTGGIAYNLSVGGAGVFDVRGYVVFEGTGTTAGGGPNDATLIVRNGATLVLGATSINNKSIIIVEAGGTLIINGNLTIDDNQGSFTIGGTLQVNGNLSIPQGNIQIDGAGDVFTTGTVFSTGSSIIFGSTGDCDTGPCSGRNLCSTFDNVIGANQTVCSGATPALLTNIDNDGVSGTAVYGWEISTTSSSSGYTTISLASAPTYQPPALTTTTWFRRVITDASCTGTSAPIKITVTPAGGWIGTTSNWHTASNWCSGVVPTATTDVEISAGVPFQPVISAGAVCRNLTINSGASVTISASNSLDIKGNLTNSGTLTVNTSTVSFTGTTLQTISGTSVNTFNNLTLNNTSGLTPGIRIGGINNVAVNNALVFTAGLVDLNGYSITIGSSTASPGSITYTAGRFYGGNVMRWFNATAKALGAIEGFFPVGSPTDYRPFYVGHTALTTGGTVRVSHTGILGGQDVSFLDNGITVVRRSNSYWTMATANGLAAAGTPFSLRGEGTGFGSIQFVSDVRMTQVGSAAGMPGTNGGVPTNPQVLRNTLGPADVNNDNFYFGAILNINTTLPIELTSFTAMASGGVVELNWVTESELNNDFFTVERMNGESLFEPLEVVNGNGTVNSRHSYTAYDRNPKNGDNYYRLKQTDFDGTSTYSKVVTVKVNEAESLNVYPNPVNSEDISIKMKNLKPGEVITFDIFSIQQAKIFSATVIADGAGTIHLQAPTAQWRSGMYVLRLQGHPQDIVKIWVR